MKRILLVLLLLPAITWTQENFSMYEAVIGQWTKFRPASLNDAHWLPGEDKIIYYSARANEMLSIPASGGEPSTFLTSEKLGKDLGIEVNSLRGVRFVNPTEAIIQNGNDFLLYNRQTGKHNLLARYPEPAENVDYSHEARAAAYTIGNNLFIAKGEDQRSVTDYQDKNIVSGQSIARNEFGISGGTFWSPNGSYLAFYQKDESNVHDYPLLDITTTPGSLNMIKYPMAGQTSEKARIGIYNMESDKTIYLQVEGDPEQYLTNVAWDPSEDFIYLAVLNRDQNHMWLNKYEAASGKMVKTLFEERHEKYVEPEHPCTFIPGSTDFLWFSERDGFTHLYRYTKDGKLINQVTKGDYEVEEIIGLDPKSKYVFVLTTDETGLNTVVRRVDLKKGTTLNITRVQGAHSAELSTNGKYILDAYSNLTTPYVQEVLSSSGKKVSLLNNAENPYKGQPLGTTKLVDVQAKDGTILHARLILPHNFDSTKKYPVMVYVYGGPHAQLVTNSWLGGASLWMHQMANRGYIIWTLDNRGSANRGFNFENVIHRQLGTIEMEDQLAGVEYLKSLPYANVDNMAIHGWSFGGFMTTSLMLRYPGVFKVGVAGGPVTDWNYYEVMYGERYMDRPEQNPEGYKTAKLMNYVENLEGNLLLIHGTIDPVVVMQHNLSLIKAFVDAGVQVDFFAYPNHQHNVRGKDRVHLMEKVLNYIDQNLN